jgi:hypothetical protein
MKVSGILAILFATTALAQTPAPKPPDQPKTADVVIKDTPASQALIQFAKDKSADQAAFDTRIQQAQFSLNQSNKALQDQIAQANKDLLEKLKADKKYKPLIDNLDNLNAQLSSNGDKIRQDFQKDVGPIQQKLNFETDEVKTLIPVVRQENDLPDTATFDEKSGKWTVPEKK